jgi:diguanylate cyclase (GGDEF)-like protein
VWPLTLLLAGLGLALTLGPVADLPQPEVGLSLPWWAFVLIVAAVEFPLIHLHVRSEAHSVTLGELALCIGLFLVPPPTLVLGAVLGAVLAKSRQVPVKLAFNTAMSLLQAATAAVVFHAVADLADPFGARSVAAAFLAMAVVGALGVVAVSGAIALAQGMSRLRPLIGAAVIAGPVNVANAGLGIVATYLITQAPALVLALAGPLTVLFLVYRAFVVEHQEHGRLRVVYTATRAVLEADEIGGAIDAVLHQAREVFRAEVAQIVLHSDEPGGNVVVTTLGASDASASQSVASLERSVFADVVLTGHAAMLDAAQASALGGLIGDGAPQVREVIVAPLTGERRVMGAIAVANRLGVAGGFDGSDLVLLETLAGHAGVAIGNGRLERTLDELRDLQDELARRATHDALTGLANRAHFAATLDAALDGGAGPVGLIYVDLDDFKNVNDTHGHAAGDRVLREIAERLRADLREQDMAGRLGGDEFAVLLTGVTGVEQLTSLAERLQRRLERPVPWGDVVLEAGVSLGVALASGDVDAEALLSDGDTAMYYAKRAGKGRSALYDVAMRDAHTTRSDLIAALSQAVERGELVLHYQPIVSVGDGRVVAVEALVRWERPGWGILAPAAFVPLAEEAGLVTKIGHWVVREACGQVARWNLSGVGHGELRVAVNVSPEQLDDEDFDARILEAVHASGLPAELLNLEIGESALTPAADQRRARLGALRARGVRVALDNFGTGSSTLATLGDAPVDAVKIPGRFVGTDHDPDRPCLAGALVAVGRALGLPAVAEMIETPAQLAVLERLGCGFAQGHAVAAAMPAAELELWILAGGMRPRVGRAGLAR